MANGTRSPPVLPSGSAQQQQHALSSNDVAPVKQQQQAATAAAHPANGGAHSATQLQQRAAAAAQFLSAERKISSREIQAMLEKNDAALRGWNVLHTQEPPKTLVKEHKEWIRKCMTYRQQVGARLEVLASLADKQIAIEDESSDRAKKVKTQPERVAPPVVPQTAAKKSKASAALARQVAQNKLKQQAAASAPAPVSRAATATSLGNSSNSNSSASNAQLTTPVAPIPSPTSFPEPPMPMASAVNPQQFGYPAGTGNGAFYGSNQSAAMTSTGFSDASLGGVSNAALASTQTFPMSGAQSFANSSYMNAGDPAAFMSQQNYMMNPAAAMNMAMMNPQYLAMQMQMQSQMPMNMAAAGAAGMYNSNAMFNSGYGAMNSNQLPADPFNTSFNQPVFPNQPQFNPVTGVFDTMTGMQSAAMMNQMNTFPMMPEQMMMNSFPYGMSMPQQQQQQQLPQQLQQQQPQQPQSQQQAQNANMQFQNPGTGAAQTLGAPQQQQQQQDSQTNMFPESSLFDDAIASNLFDGFPEDAFLLEM